MRFLAALALSAVMSTAHAQAFSVHRNGADQTGFEVGKYNLVKWLSCDIPTCDRFYNFTWRPVQQGEKPRFVTFQGSIWVRENARGAKYTAYIVKAFNDTPFKVFAFPCSVGDYPNSRVCNVSIGDSARAGDSYYVMLYASDADAVIDGDVRHTFFSGHVTGAQ